MVSSRSRSARGEGHPADHSTERPAETLPDAERRALRRLHTVWPWLAVTLTVTLFVLLVGVVHG